MRAGVIAKKVGMTRYYNTEGSHIPVTLLQLDACQVVDVRTEEKNGYNAVLVGAGSAKPKNVSKSVKGVFAKAKVSPKAKLAEFRVAGDALLKPGSELSVNHYVIGQQVDLVGTSKGKGFAGGMKRHGFGGLEATHGVSISHRSHGSTGQCQDPGRVFKGKKMAGHLGDVRVTSQNVEIVDIDEELGIIAVNGAVPGAKGGYILISDAKKYARPAEAPYPAGLKEANAKPKAAEKPEESAEAENKNDDSAESNNKDVETKEQGVNNGS